MLWEKYQINRKAQKGTTGPLDKGEKTCSLHYKGRQTWVNLDNLPQIARPTGGKPGGNL